MELIVKLNEYKAALKLINWDKNIFNNISLHSLSLFLAFTSISHTLSYKNNNEKDLEYLIISRNYKSIKINFFNIS